MARIWKKLGLFILIVACLFNIVTKLTTKTPVSEELKTSADYVKTIENNINKNNNQVKQ